MESRGKAIDFSYTSMKGLYILSILLDNLSEAEDLLSWLKGRKEIGSVKMEIMKEFIFLDEWLDERVNRQISLRDLCGFQIVRHLWIASFKLSRVSTMIVATTKSRNHL